MKTSPLFSPVPKTPHWPLVIRWCLLAILASGAPRAFAEGSPTGYLAITDVRVLTASDEGTIEAGTVLIRDGQIEAVGKEVSIPSGAAVFSAPGKTLMPGVIDPYYVVNVPGTSASSGTRTIVFQGRVFVIGGSPAATDTSFVRISDAFVPANWNWRTSVRSGITTALLTSRGHGLSCTASPRMDADAVRLNLKTPQTYIAVTNDPASLKVLRAGLKSPKKSAEKDDDDASSAEIDPNDPWDAVRAGKRPLLINANNAAAVLYVAKELRRDENQKVQIGLVVSGQDAILCMESLDDLPADRVTLILQPVLTSEPTTRRLVNVAEEARRREIPFVFSLATNQSIFRESQDVPFFSVTQLVQYGLDRDAALAALTSGSAKLIGIEKRTGSIEPDKQADLILLDADPFSATARIERVWSGGSEIYSFESGTVPTNLRSGS